MAQGCLAVRPGRDGPCAQRARLTRIIIPIIRIDLTLRQHPLAFKKDPCIQMLDTFKEYMDNQLGDIERKINKSITEEWDKIDKSITTD